MGNIIGGEYRATGNLGEGKVFDPLRERIAKGLPYPAIATAIAAWVHFIAKSAYAENPGINDPMAQELIRRARLSRCGEEIVANLLGIAEADAVAAQAEADQARDDLGAVVARLEGLDGQHKAAIDQIQAAHLEQVLALRAGISEAHQEAEQARTKLATDALWVEQTLRFQISVDEDMLARMALDAASGIAQDTIAMAMTTW